MLTDGESMLCRDFSEILSLILQKNMDVWAINTNGAFLREYKLVSVSGTSSDDSHLWTKGSGKDVEITGKIAPGKDDSFAHFQGLQVDGTAWTKDTDYTAKEGSTIVTLKGTSIEKLSLGKHVVTLLFDNGKLDVTLTVKAKDAESVGTGDESNPGLWTLLMALALAGSAGILRARKRLQ